MVYLHESLSVRWQGPTISSVILKGKYFDKKGIMPWASLEPTSVDVVQIVNR
jgi:hypothetical protein